jgi:hypothetical protein
MVKHQVYIAVKEMKFAILYGYEPKDIRPWLRWMAFGSIR